MTIAATVSAYEAKTHFSALLDRAGRGETVTITKHGHPVARLVPFEEPKPSIVEAIDRIRGLRAGWRLDGLSVRDLVEEGRRY